MTKEIEFCVILAVIMTSMGFTILPVYAETMISISMGSSTLGCEETNECYIPYEVTVDAGNQATWSNDDFVAHTVTSGDVAGGPDDVFDSSLLTTGKTFSHTFDEEGTFNYFCTIHPWMKGIIMVEKSTEVKEEPITGEGEEEKPAVDDEEKTVVDKTKSTEIETSTTEFTMDVEGDRITLDYDIISGKILDIYPDMEINSLIIELNATDHGLLTVTLPRDVIDAIINGEDDDFFVLVNEEEVDFEEIATFTNRTLSIQFSEDADEIEIIGSFVIPEFGTIAMMILYVSIISIIAVSARSRLSIMPRL